MINSRVKKILTSALGVLMVPFISYSAANLMAQQPDSTVTVTTQHPDGSVESTTTSTSTVITVTDLSTTDAISQAQIILRDRGYYHGSISGVMNDRTRDAIKEFQEDHHLAKTKRLDLTTARVLGLNDWFASRRAVVLQGNGDTTVAPVVIAPVGIKTRHVFSLGSVDAVMLTQQLLRDRGYYRGDINGRMNEKTRDAIEKFQDDNHLKETGRLDEATARMLGIDFDSLSY